METGNTVIVWDPDIPGGTPVFRGGPAPLQALFDSLEGGETLEDFLGGSPGVTREMAIAALEQAQQFCPRTPKCGFCSTSASIKG